ncbi:hypothetical protein BpHYR1_002644 [Brachionus plicatilis]|uniref:Uncharacterized protein n=1 Tax=Brachionus plicatilis TaxID=10195 RepID=A0A3M7QQU2_BRAPC|nr:hypothetical protein BpHYR1_002644 [Brachionus plicatilis]
METLGQILNINLNCTLVSGMVDSLTRFKNPNAFDPNSEDIKDWIKNFDILVLRIVSITDRMQDPGGP